MEEFDAPLFVEMIRQLGREGSSAADRLSVAMIEHDTEEGHPDDLNEGLDWLDDIVTHEVS